MSALPFKPQYRRSAPKASPKASSSSTTTTGSSSSLNHVALSKKLSKVLRHDALKHKLELNAEGFVSVTALMRSAPFRGARHSVDDIRAVVASCPKQRFALRQVDGELFIRANQGHTIAVDEDKLLVPLTAPPPLVFHGTYHAPLSAILAQGLSRMQRTHIHFANGFDAASGMRVSCTVLIVVDVRKALADGVKFFTSANGVVLTAGNAAGFLEPKYFAAVLDAKTRLPLAPDAPPFDLEAHQLAQVAPATPPAAAATTTNDDDDDDGEDARVKKSRL